MTRHTQTITVDNTRLNEAVEVLEQAYRTAAAFRTDRLVKLTAIMPALEAAMNVVNVTDMKLGNMYSSGGILSPEYAPERYLIVNGTMTDNKVYKNKDLRSERLNRIFDTALIGKDVSFIQRPTQIRGTEIEFQLYIK